MSSVTIRGTAGTLLIVAGVTAVSWSSFVTARAAYVRWAHVRALPAEAVDTPRAGAPIGLLEIPRLGLTSIVVEGDDPASLRVAAGHLPDTPFPWESGNSAVAGHRDTDFAPLEGIGPGDIVHFATADRRLDYVVRATRIVEPTDISVLAATDQPMLTLITCYPFRYIGATPKRFVVHAERMTPGDEVE
ncbi:MAG: class D sortase [Vicinamibacterales bacterium]